MSALLFFYKSIALHMRAQVCIECVVNLPFEICLAVTAAFLWYRIRLPDMLVKHEAEYSLSVFLPSSASGSTGLFQVTHLLTTV